MLVLTVSFSTEVLIVSGVMRTWTACMRVLTGRGSLTSQCPHKLVYHGIFIVSFDHPSHSVLEKVDL